MTKKCKVINMHPQGLTHVEFFKGDKIEIPAGQFIVMDYEDATNFKSQYFPMKFDAMEQPDPTGFKCLKLEPILDESVEEKTVEKVIYVCNLDGKKFETAEALNAHISSNYSDRIVVDEVAEKEMEHRKKR
ncbi:MAG: hypothetical protein HW379_1603 [Actinobacteria bacterium]|nr:hypothetical protein [Actinomycetota bacterium]